MLLIVDAKQLKETPKEKKDSQREERKSSSSVTSQLANQGMECLFVTLYCKINKRIWIINHNLITFTLVGHRVQRGN